jgi:phytoene dehydrogenase-like protein
VNYDAVIVGGGHNGLVCGAYLAKAGLRVVIVEARASVGGCASTVDALGARVNICNCDHGTFRNTPIADELGLGDHGLRYFDVEPAQVNLPWCGQGAGRGGPAWPLFHDVDRTLESIALTYPLEVEGYRRYARAARPVVELVLELANHPPTPGGILAKLASRRARGVATLLRWSRMSVAAVLRSFFSSDALVAPAIVSGPAVWGVAPSTPGTGLGAISYMMKQVVQIGRPVGGSGGLPAALQAAFLAAGGQVMTGQPVRAIQCDGQRARSVVLGDGTELEGRMIVVACDPRDAFVSWLRNPPAMDGLTTRWRETPVLDGYESKVDAVVAEAPRYEQTDPQVVARLGYDPLAATTMIAPPTDEIEAAHRAMREGRVAGRPMFYANVPSALDPTMKVGDDHVFSLEVLYTPYAVAGGWASSTEPGRWLDRYATLVQPGFLSGVRRWRAMTPDRYESEFHLPRGHAPSFAGGPVAALLGRRPELTRYETPVAGLYLTGAATFPGAGVWGASGRNAATVILRHAR